MRYKISDQRTSWETQNIQTWRQLWSMWKIFLNIYITSTSIVMRTLVTQTFVSMTFVTNMLIYITRNLTWWRRITWDLHYQYPWVPTTTASITDAATPNCCYYCCCYYYYCWDSPPPTPSQTPKGPYGPYNILSELMETKKLN